MRGCRWLDAALCRRMGATSARGGRSARFTSRRRSRGCRHVGCGSRRNRGRGRACGRRYPRPGHSRRRQQRGRRRLRSGIRRGNLNRRQIHTRRGRCRGRRGLLRRLRPRPPGRRRRRRRGSGPVTDTRPGHAFTRIRLAVDTPADPARGHCASEQNTGNDPGLEAAGATYRRVAQRGEHGIAVRRTRDFLRPLRVAAAPE